MNHDMHLIDIVHYCCNVVYGLTSPLSIKFQKICKTTFDDREIHRLGRRQDGTIVYTLLLCKVK